VAARSDLIVQPTGVVWCTELPCTIPRSSAEEIKDRFNQLREEILNEHRRVRDKVRPDWKRRLCDPERCGFRPEKTKQGKRPKFHAATTEVWLLYVKNWESSVGLPGDYYFGSHIIERLWRSLKYECVYYLHELSAGSQARAAIGGWIDHYSDERSHSTLGGRAPGEVFGGYRFEGGAAVDQKTAA
jgi:hypothetical protein